MREVVYLDYNNYEQMTWFFKQGAKAAKWVLVDKIIETATGKAVGALYDIRGFGRKKIIKKAASFHKNSVRREIVV